MNWKIELIFVPVTDVDRAKAFYVDQVGFHDDFDQTVNDELRFVQLTPPGSACSIAFGRGLSDMEPGSQRGIQVVIPNAEEARAHLVANGVDASDGRSAAVGPFRDVLRPGRQPVDPAGTGSAVLTGRRWAVYLPYQL